MRARNDGLMMRSPKPVVVRSHRKKIFLIFVDAIFTTLFERLFTKLLDVTGADPANTCLYRACNAD
jgi:hypothetical protein